MKNLLLIFTFMWALVGHGQEELKGQYDVGEDNTRVIFAWDQSQMVGKLASSDAPQAPIGTVLVKNIRPSGEGYVAQIYAPKRQTWYDANLVLKDAILVIEISVGIFSKTLEWKKI